MKSRSFYLAAPLVYGTLAFWNRLLRELSSRRSMKAKRRSVQLRVRLATGIKNHAFMDGNKRIGLASIATFLRLNGHVLTAPAEEQIAMVWGAAASEITEAEFTAWVERSVAEL